MQCCEYITVCLLLFGFALVNKTLVFERTMFCMTLCLQKFNRARDITRWTYQWIVVQDFLKTVAKADIVDNILNDSTNILDLDKRGGLRSRNHMHVHVLWLC